MNITVEFIENSEQLFWISETKISNKNEGRFYPNEISDIGSGKSVAIYEKNNQGEKIR